MDVAQCVKIIPVEQKAAPIIVTVRYEYFTDKIEDKGPSDE